MNSMGMVCAIGALALSGGSLAVGQVLTFTEVSDETGIVAENYNGGQPYNNYISGGAVGDFNRDGWQDLFVLSDSIRPDRLYINNKNGTFSERAASWGIDLVHFGFSATVVDYNGDGWPDISVSSAGPADGIPRAGRNMMYRNNGDGTFSEVAEQLGIAFRVNALDSFGTAFGDYDHDGDLDMFSTAYSTGQQGNRLWRNNLRETGVEGFTDVTVQAGIQQHIPVGVSGFLAGFADMDADGWLDIILVGDRGTSRYFRGSPSGVFIHASNEVERLHAPNGMGLAIGDVNRDGLLDFYISSIEFEGVPSSGNTLYVQRAAGGFDEVGVSMAVNRGGWGWGVLFADLDHDGWEEIIATQNADSQRTRLYKRVPSHPYAEIAATCGLDHFAGGRGMVNFDYDNDGDQDLVIFSSGGFGPVRIGVWRNDLKGPSTNWMRVELDTSARPGLAPDGFGSFVKIAYGRETHLQTIDGATSHCSSGEHGAHFGMRDAERADWVRVEWTDGTSTTLAGVDANQILRVRAPAHPADLTGDDLADMADIMAFGEAFRARSPVVDLDGNGAHDLADVQRYITWLVGG